MKESFMAMARMVLNASTVGRGRLEELDADQQ
jgi:hypothetical protein